MDCLHVADVGVSIIVLLMWLIVIVFRTVNRKHSE